MRFGLPVLLVMAGVLYAPSLGNGFTLDDRHVAMAVMDGGEPNPRVAALQPLGQYFSTPYWQGGDRFDPLYRPVTILSYAVVYALIGRHLSAEREALPQHALNVLLHALCVWLVYRLLWPLGGGGPALLGAAAFALAAIHSEVVATVAGRAELLSFAGGAGGLLLVLRSGGERAGWRRWACWAGAASLLFLAASSKENAVVWLALWPLWSMAQARHRGAGLRAMLATAAGAALGALPPLAAFLVLRQQALVPPPEHLPVAWFMNPIQGAPLGERLLTATMLWPWGLSKMLWPVPLAADYGASVFATVTSPGDPRFLLALAVVLGLVALGVVAAARSRPLLALAPAVLLGASLPFANLLFPIGTPFAERLWFTPSLGLACAAVWLARSPGAWRLPLAVVGLGWAALNATIVWQRCPVWRDNETLFLHDARVQPRSLFLRLNAAIAAHRRVDAAARDRHLADAVAIEPRFARGWHDLGCLQLDRGELALAAASFEKGLASPLADRTDRLLLHAHLGLTLARAGKPAEGAAQLEASLRADPRQLAARWEDLDRRLGGTLRQGDALALLRLGKTLLPADPRWDAFLGAQLVRQGRWAEAESHVAATLANARTLARGGRRPEALALLRGLVSERSGPASLASDPARARHEELRRQARALADELGR